MVTQSFSYLFHFQLPVNDHILFEYFRVKCRFDKIRIFLVIGIIKMGRNFLYYSMRFYYYIEILEKAEGGITSVCPSASHALSLSGMLASVDNPYVQNI
jgi:hypothetical protein